MRALVTGATGFIGTHLCHRLVENGHDVVALVRDPAKAKALPQTRFELLHGDLSLFSQPEVVLPACDVVVHLAGVIAAKQLADYEEVNFVAVQRLVQCLKRQRWRPKRFLFASSLAAAGPSASDVPKSEADACAPVEPYGQSKLRAEEFLKSAPFPTTAFRPALVLGEGDRATLTLFRMARRGLGFRVAGTNPGLSYVDIEDLIDALMKLLADESKLHRTYFVSHTAPADTLALWAALGEATGHRVRLAPVPRPVLYGAMVLMTALSKLLPLTNQLDRKQYEQLTAPGFVCSSAALQKDFGWTPKHDLRAATARAAEGFTRAGWL